MVTGARTRRVSFQELDCFDRCPRKYWLKYREKRRPRAHLVSRESVVGGVLHDTLKDCFLTLPVEQRTAPGFEQALRKRWRQRTDRTLAFSSPDEERMAGLEAIRALQWVAAEPELMRQPFAVEHTCVASIEPGLELGGRLDRVDRGPDETLVVSDYKTGRVPMDRWFDQARQQLVLYAFLAQESFRRPVSGARFVYLQAHEYREVQPSSSQIAAVRDDVRRAVMTIDSESEFAPSSGPLCRWCDYLPDCDAGQTAVASVASPADRGS